MNRRKNEWFRSFLQVNRVVRVYDLHVMSQLMHEKSSIKKYTYKNYLFCTGVINVVHIWCGKVQREREVARSLSVNV